MKRFFLNTNLPISQWNDHLMQWAMISKELHKKTVWLFGLLAKTKSRNFICKFIGHEQQVLRTIHRKVIDVVACICNSVILEAALRNAEGSIPSGSNSPLIGGWILWPFVMQHKVTLCLDKYYARILEFVLLWSNYFHPHFDTSYFHASLLLHLEPNPFLSQLE